MCTQTPWLNQRTASCCHRSCRRARCGTTGAIGRMGGVAPLSSTGEPISGEILLGGGGVPVVMPLAQQRSVARVVQHKRSPRTLNRKSSEDAHRRLGKRAVAAL